MLQKISIHSLVYRLNRAANVVSELYVLDILSLYDTFGNNFFHAAAYARHLDNMNLIIRTLHYSSPKALCIALQELNHLDYNSLQNALSVGNDILTSAILSYYNDHYSSLTTLLVSSGPKCCDTVACALRSNSMHTEKILTLVSTHYENLFKTILSTLDTNGQAPVHIACTYKSSVVLVVRHTQEYGSGHLLSVTDANGLCPIIWLIKNYRPDYYTIILHYIRTSSLEDLSLQDNHGNSVLQLLVDITKKERRLADPVVAMLEQCCMHIEYFIGKHSIGNNPFCFFNDSGHGIAQAARGTAPQIIACLKNIIGHF